MTYKSKQQGFTIVELLIVIVVIGILAALVITTFTGIQQKARDTERTTDIKAVYGQVEAYYAQHGNYPTFAHLDSSSWRGTDMKGLDNEAVRDPKGGTSLAASPAANVYSYEVFQDDGTTSCASDESTCAKYTLTATLEAGGTFVRSNLN